MGKVGIGNPRTGQEKPNLARQLRDAGDGGGGLRRGGAAFPGAGGDAEFPSPRQQPAPPGEFECRGHPHGGSRGGAEAEER